MEVTEQIQVFQEFLEIHYIAHLLEEVRKGQTYFVVDYGLLAKHSPELAEMLLEQPEEVIKACELSISNFDLPKEVKSFHIRFSNLPEKHKIYVRNIRSEHINKLLVVEGTIRQKSDVRPQVTAARFECPSCGNVMNVLQLDSKFKEPSRCGCGRKGKFRLLSKELIDVQGIVLEEATKDLEGGAQPKRINVLLKQDLVSPMSDKKTNPGTTLQIIGMLKEIPIILRSGGQSTKYDLLLEANNIVPLEEDYSTIEIKPDEEEQIKKIANDPKIYQKLATSLAPGIYGHQKIKEALILQFVGGVKKLRDDGVMSRGDIHVLLIGDPGAGKSQLLKRAAVVAPKARFVSGKGVSGAGLCVSPNSLLLTNPGGIETIENVVEPRLDNPKRVQQDVWKQEHVNSVKIQSLTKELKIQSQIPEALWKLKAPDIIYEITLASGKKIEITGNTQLLTLQNGALLWKKSMEFQEQEYIATPRRLIGGNMRQQATVDFIVSNPVVHNVKDFVEMLTLRLKEKYGNLRAASKKLQVAENNLYFHWVNEKARGNIKLRDLKKIAEDVHTPWKQNVRKISLYNGKCHTIPLFLDQDFFYVSGLIAGDGDIRKSGKTYSIRFSNSIPLLHTFFRNVLEQQFALHFDIQKGNSQRPTATRTHSKIVAQVLFSLGIPESPKSHKLSFSNALLHLTNDLLCHYIAGIYDTDGSVSIRKTKGSDCIDFTTCSELLARQLQLVLLRFDIHATMRKRKPSTGKIKGKHDKWIVEIRGGKEIHKFVRQIPLRHPEKKKKLAFLAKKHTQTNTNIDIIPTVPEKIRSLLIQKKMSLKRYGWRKNLSRIALKKILRQFLITTPEEKEVEKIVNADIFWERIKKIRKKKPNYPYVYDLTVQDAHNFVVDGVLVHNTAAVVKDEFLQGWSLEAGAMVLANKGILMIDEMDKMTDEDRSAMHEGMEQQSFHYDTLFQFADGSEMKIGDYVESLFKKHPEKIIGGKDCLILKMNAFDKQMLTTDWEKIEEVSIDRISKHKAPSSFVEIVLMNGRKIVVTPEHPVFCIEQGKLITKEAKDITKNDCVPIPLHIPIPGQEQTFDIKDGELYNSRATQHIAVPMHNDKNFYKIVGYLLAEGSKEINRGKSIGINFTNNDISLIKDFNRAVQSVFGLVPYIQKTNKDGETWWMTRYVSTELNAFLQRTVPEALLVAAEKEIPQVCMKGKKEDIAALLSCMFEGDGHATKKQRTIRVGYTSASKRLCEQIQDLLLRFKVRSNINQHKKIWKVLITGYENIFRFYYNIGFVTTRKNKVIQDYLSSNKGEIIRTVKDVIPNIQQETIALLQKYCIPFVGKNTLATMKHDYIKRKRSISRKHLQKIVSLLDKKARNEDLERVSFLKKLAFGEIGFERIRSVSTLPNTNQEWTYDITIEPHHAFVSQNMILHNTISISKANIQATLRCETTILAAANPKLGRFDPYEPIAKQINMPPALINRFDLIFSIKDLPDKEKDEELAHFVLSLHKRHETAEVDIPTDLLRKYLIYARQKVFPRLSDQALEELKEYYVKMRSSGGEDKGIKAIPISARQLEALVRLSEAAAKVRLSDTITRKDARYAINILHYCLEQIGLDPETGKIDIDRITTGITTSERAKIVGVREIIHDLEEKLNNKIIPIEEIIKAAGEKGLTEEKVIESIEKLKRSGDLFEPRKGHISRI
jgi:replicative DNA helicase Mcm